MKELFGEAPMWYRYVSGLGLLIAVPGWAWLSLSLQPHGASRRAVYWLLRACTLVLMSSLAVGFLWSWNVIPRFAFAALCAGSLVDLWLSAYRGSQGVMRWLAVILALPFCGTAIVLIMSRGWR